MKLWKVFMLAAMLFVAFYGGRTYELSIADNAPVRAVCADGDAVAVLSGGKFSAFMCRNSRWTVARAEDGREGVK